MSGVTGGFRCAALTVVLVLAATASEAQPSVKQVLMLHSLDRGNLTLDQFTGNFRVDLDARAGTPVNVVQVVVGPTGLVGAPEPAVVHYLGSIFGGDRTPDLIVTVGGPAAVFARKYRQQLFPDTPLLFASVDQRYLRDAPLGDNETAVAVINDFPRLVDDILQVLPQTRQVFMVTGSGALGKFWRRELEEDFKRFRDRLTFVWSDELSFPEIQDRVGNLPRHSAIFYLAFSTDALGGGYADERVLRDLRAGTNAPIFSGMSVMLGHGTVGGSLLSIEDLARRTADVAVRLLKGEAPRNIRVPPQLKGTPIFDLLELEKWGIAESRLPPGSLVRNRGPNLWEKYRFMVLSAAGVLIMQSVLIAGLLYQRRARQRAEIDSRKNLALAADANRRVTMSALTSSIAHELGQPLSAMLCNAQALQMMVTANRATPDTMGEVLADIRTQGVRATQIIDRHRTMLRSREVDKKPIDLHSVITESVALVAHDMRARQIQTTMNLSSSSSMINGDQVLLQQVLVNLLMNAMDAMAETPPAGRHITIRSDVRAADVEVSVGDTGTGLPAHINGTLFTPFVTTKSQGLGIGLTIVRTILDAHGGTIAGRNNPDGGATFTLTVSRSGMPRILSEQPVAATLPS